MIGKNFPQRLPKNPYYLSMERVSCDLCSYLKNGDVLNDVFVFEAIYSVWCVAKYLKMEVYDTSQANIGMRWVNCDRYYVLDNNRVLKFPKGWQFVFLDVDLVHVVDDKLLPKDICISHTSKKSDTAQKAVKFFGKSSCDTNRVLDHLYQLFSEYAVDKISRSKNSKNKFVVYKAT
jgi:hypothetical protein